MNISYQTASDLYNKILTNGNTYMYSYQKRVREADGNVQELRKDIESFRKNLRELKNYDSDSVTRSKLERNLEKFAKTYNDLKKSSENITDKELSKMMSKLDDFMEENKKSLKKIGLKESDGKWSFDKEVFEEVKDKDIIAVCEGNDSIFNQMNKMMRKVEKKADEEEYQLVTRKFHSVTQYSQQEMTQANEANVLYSTISSLQSGNSVVQNYDASTGAFSSEITNSLQSFCAYYNALVDDYTESSQVYINSIMEKTQANKTHLLNVGIELNEGTLNYVGGKEDSAEYKSSYAALFGEDGENATYGTSVKTQAKNIFNKTMKTDSLGITIDSYA